MTSFPGASRGVSFEAPREGDSPTTSRGRWLRITDAVIIVVYGVFAVGLAILSVEPPFVTPVWSLVALGVAGLTALAVRRRYPRLAFAAAMMLAVLSFAVGSGAEGVLGVIAVYSAGVHRSALGAWLGFGIAMACGALGAVALLLRGSSLPPILGLQPPVMARDTVLDWANTYVIIAVALLIAALLGINTGHRRRHIGELVDKAERLARERDHEVEIARALERESIAREMHDVIAHSLSVIIAVSDGAHSAADDRPGEAKEAIARVAATSRKTLGEVRRLLGGVRGEHPSSTAGHAPQPDATQLASLVAEFVTAGLPVRLVMSGTPPIEPALGLTVYRIVQESLTNVLRHARNVTSATVTVTWASDEVTILVRDVGATIMFPASTGRGIVGMRERVALYGGIIEAGPHKDGGWRVCAQLRWEVR